MRSTQFVQIESHHAPHHKIVFFFDQTRRVQIVFCQQLHHTTAPVQTLDRELVVELRQHHMVVLGADTAVSCAWSAAGDGKPAGTFQAHTSSHRGCGATKTGKFEEIDGNDMPA
jgi:hypothetical protein